MSRSGRSGIDSDAGTTAHPKGARRAVFTAMMLLIPFVFFGVLEGGLRLAGFGAAYPLFVDVPGVPGWRVQNREVARRYFMHQERVPSGLGDAFLARPDTNVFRIVVQGGSSAAGYPYYYGGSFSRMLQQRLQQSIPDRRIEVINTGLAAVNSYTLLDFVDEIIAIEPDLILIYAGHNEYYGALGVGSSESIGRSRFVVRTLLRFHDWRIVQGLRTVLGSLAGLVAGPKTGEAPGRTLMERMVGEQQIPLDSDLYRAGLDQFRGNLRALLGRYASAEIPVYVSTIVSNERDHAPFVSLPGPYENRDAWDREVRGADSTASAGDTTRALALFDALATRDNIDAYVRFRRGQLLDGSRHFGGARSAYMAARDRDQLRFRAPSEINDIIRDEVAAAGARLVDSETALRAASPDSILDGTLLLEHLHPNIEGYFLIADTFYGRLRSDLRELPWRAYVSRDVARSERLVTAVDSLNGRIRLIQLLGSWPFQPPGAIDRSMDFVARTEEDSLALRLFRGELSWYDATDGLRQVYAARGDFHRALLASLALIQQYPFLRTPHLLAGETLLRQQRIQEALAYFEAADEIEPSTAIRVVIGDIWAGIGETDSAGTAYLRASDLDPSNVDAALKLGRSQLMLGDTVVAVQTLENLLNRVPGEPRAERALSLLRERRQ